MPSNWLKTIGFIAIVLGAASLTAQTRNEDIRPRGNSPFSRLGIGNYFNQYLAVTAGMGGLGAAIHDPFHLNLINPASLPYMRSTAFEIGTFANYNQLQEGDQKADIWSGGLGYMALGFPLRNRVNVALDRDESPWDFGMNFALVPYTQVEYDIVAQEEKEGFNVATNRLKGDGGIYRLQWGNGVKYKGFSAGFSLLYNFGNMINNRKVEFDSLAHSFDTEFLDELSVGGMSWNAGLMYTHNFKENNDKGELVPSGKRLIFGVQGHSMNRVNTKSSNLYVRSNFVSYSPNPVIDTISNISDFKQKMTLPSEYSFGITYENINKVKIGVEYGLAQWSQYQNPAKPETLENSQRIAIGFEYIPDATAYNSYSKKMFYRAGFYTGSDPRSINGEQLNRTGITLGVGFPIIMPRQQLSFFDISLELGRFGVKDVIRENYARLTLGFTLNDNSWFFKRKFN